MRAKTPMLVTFIGDLNLLSAFLIIVSFFLKYIEPFGVYVILRSNLLDSVLKILMIIVLLIIAYGFFKLKPYAYWLMIFYNFLFLVLSMFCIITKNNELNLGQELIPSLMALIITFPSKRYFVKDGEYS